MQVVVYGIGTERILYQSIGFKAGVAVSGFIWDPDLIKSESYTFVEVESGLYYLDINFDKFGKHIILIEENSVPKLSAVFNVLNVKKDSQGRVMLGLGLGLG